MNIFYGKSFDKHNGLDSSFENKNRVGNTVVSLKCIYPDVHNIVIPNEWLYLLKNLKTRYDETFFVNCETCSYRNIENLGKCTLCNSPIKGDVKLISSIEGDTTFMCSNTLECLEDLLKVAIYTIDYQLKTNENCFLLSRPPGHHCDNISPSGFCLINTVSLMAERILNFCKKVCIIDIDVHHGNGTQKIFYNRDDVFFIDIHRDNFYPFTGNNDEKGIDKGLGYTLNIPLNKGSNEDDYINVMIDKVIPSLKNYNPDWILVSCGFDAHIDDPLGGMKLTTISYTKISKLINGIGKKTTYILEGGYNSDVIRDCIKSITD